MPGWTKEQVIEVLKSKGWYSSERDIQDGPQFSLSDGTTVNFYPSRGRVVVQGKATAIKLGCDEIFGVSPDATPSTILPSSVGETTLKRVFIVYGHDALAREQLELILRRLRLEPIVLQNLPAAGDTIIEKLEVLTEADFACVLLTPDDEGHRKDYPQEKRPRARQNVALEMGMVLAKLGRKRVAILVKGDEMERPSDINGLIYISFRDHVSEITTAIAANLQGAGFDIQVKDLLG